jgi:hypothetical protein
VENLAVGDRVLALGDILSAYDVSGRAAETKVLKVVLNA